MDISEYSGASRVYCEKKTLLNLLINSNLRKCRRDDSAFLHSQRDSAEFCAVYTDRK